MVIWKVDYTNDDYNTSEMYVGYVDYWPTKREALRACRERDIPTRNAEITKLTLKSKYDAINALGDALMTDNSFGGV
tara:strand:+ start:7483 stop:7713 length:231 start_codon:yes stop_codon:yes gene_type:complete